jgi:hypothetical protein
MASDGQSVKIPAANLVNGSQAPTIILSRNSGNDLPQNGKTVASTAAQSAAAAAAATAAAKTQQPAKAALPPQKNLQTQVNLLNKYLNDSGRAAQFRASTDDKAIQEVNPANGEVVAEYDATEFAALARSVGISGALVNEVV